MRRRKRRGGIREEEGVGDKEHGWNWSKRRVIKRWKGEGGGKNDDECDDEENNYYIIVLRVYNV